METPNLVPGAKRAPGLYVEGTRAEGRVLAVCPNGDEITISSWTADTDAFGGADLELLHVDFVGTGASDDS